MNAPIMLQPEPVHSEEDRARADHYALLARLFQAAPDEGLLAALVAAVVWPASAGGLLVPAHLVALFVFLVAGAATDPDSPPSMMRLYLLLWVLFYAEYGFLALHALTA